MAYQITKKKRIIETLELCHEDGTTALTINVNIDIDAMEKYIRAAQKNFREASDIIKTNPQSEQAQEAFGSAVIAMFAVIFGKDNADKIVAFYDGRYTEMLLDLFPFINDVIMPKLKAEGENKKQRFAAAVQAAKQVH